MAIFLDSETFEYKVFVFGHSIAQRTGEYATSYGCVGDLFAGFVLTLTLASGRLRESFPGVGVGILSEQ
jgi:hypothetical protein